MQTQKEIIRDTILTQMRPFLDASTTEILKQVIAGALFRVEVTQSETLPATRDHTNEYILELYNLKKVPKLSPETVKYYLTTIRNFTAFVNKSLLDVTDLDVEHYLHAYAGKGNKATTVNNERRNLSSFYNWMRKNHLVTENPIDSVEKYSEIEPVIEYMEDWEMEALREACRLKVKNKVTNIDEYRDHLRDRALVEFLRSTAVRVTECSSINLTDINWQRGEVMVYGRKNRTWRTVCLDDVAKYHLQKYVNSRCDTDAALFVSVKGSHARLKKCGIEAALRTIAKRSVLQRNVYPHLFRKTTATNMAKRGCPRELIAFYLGHKHGNTKTLNRHYAATDPAQVIAAFRQYGAAA